MGLFAVLFFIAAGIFFIVKRKEVTWVHQSVIGARLPAGCAVAEGIFLIFCAAVIGWLYWSGLLT
jgi:hypothetical protein